MYPVLNLSVTFRNLPPFLGLCSILCLLSLHLTCFSSLSSLPTGVSSLAPSHLLLRVEFQLVSDQAASTFWTCSRGGIGEGSHSLGRCQAVNFSTCCPQPPPHPPLFLEAFASALISLEIKCVSVLLNVNFLLQKLQYHV